MAQPTDIRVTFTIDLNPYLTGLKTMLQMTQSAGKQIVPLLNVKMKAPDFSPFVGQLKQYDAALQKLADEAATAGKAEVMLVPPLAGVAEKSDAAGKAVGRKTTSLRHMKREALESFGALSFLATSMIGLAQRADPTSKSLEKMSKSLSEGISAGFGLAGIMSILGIATGGTAVAIGAAVAVGTSLLNFFDDGEKRALRMESALKAWQSSMRGATTGELAGYRDALEKTIKQDKKFVEALSAPIEPRFELQAMIQRALGLNEAYNQATEGLQVHEKELKELNDRIIEGTMSSFEARKRTAELTVAAEQNIFIQRRMQAKMDLDLEVKKIIDETKAGDERNRLLLQRARLYKAQLVAILDDELKARDDHAKLIMQIEKDTATTILDMLEKEDLARATSEIERAAITRDYGHIRLDNEQENAEKSIRLEIDRLGRIREEQKKNLLDTSATDRQIAYLREQLDKIKAEFAAKGLVIDVNFNLKAIEFPAGSIAEAQDKIKALQKDFNEKIEQSDRDRISAQIREEQRRVTAMQLVNGTILKQQEKLRQAQEDVNNAVGPEAIKAAQERVKIEQDVLDRMTMSSLEYIAKLRGIEQQKRQLWMETHQFSMALIDGITAGFTNMFDQFLVSHRQAKDEFDAIWLSMRNTAMSALGQILTERIRQAFIGIGVEQAAEAEKTAAATVGAQARAAAVIAAATEQTVALGALTATQLATSSAAMAVMTAAVTSSMAVITAAASAAATLVSIASFGAAAAAGTAGVLTALATVRGATLIGFERGGELKKGKRGFIEGKETEIIAPEKTFYQVMTERIIPRLITEQHNYLELMNPQKIGAASFERALPRMEVDEKVFEGALRLGNIGSFVARAEKQNMESLRQKLEVALESQVIPVDITVHGEFELQGTHLIAKLNETQRIELRLGRPGLKVG